MPVTTISQDRLAEMIEARLREHRDGGAQEPAVPFNPRLGGPDTTTPNQQHGAAGGTWRGSVSPTAQSNIHSRLNDEQADQIMRFFRGVLTDDKGEARKSLTKLRSLGGPSARVTRATQVEGDDSLGGLFVPEEFLNEVIIELPKFTPFVDRNLIRIIPMKGMVKRIPKVKTKPAMPSIVQEEQAYSKSNAVFGWVKLIANKLGVIIPFTEDLLEDSSVDLVQLLAELVAEQVANRLNGFVTNGTGADEPEGVRTNSNVTTSAWDNTNDSTRADSIIKFFHALPSQYRRDAIWMMHDSRIERIRKLKDSQNRYLWTDGFGAQPALLLGRPVFENPDIPTNLGGGSNESEILFGNFRRGYALGRRKGLEVERDSSGTDWEKDIVNFKFRERYDGRVTDEKSFIRGTGVLL